MPVLNFKDQFADAVRSLEKRQTIRRRGKSPTPKVGDRLQLYTGRTGACNKLLKDDPVCISVEPIGISANLRKVRMPRKGVREPVWDDLGADEVEALAKADGFPAADDFFRFFADNYGPTFSGYLIKW